MRLRPSHNRYRFDLEEALRTWKRFLKLNKTFLGEDIEELEVHPGMG